MRKIVAASLPHTSATITFRDGYPPMAPTEGNRKLLAMYDAVSRDLGFGPVTAVDPRRAGAADISFAADHVEMAIDGIGLLGGGNHTPDEVRGPAHVPDPDAASGGAAVAARTSVERSGFRSSRSSGDAARLPGNTCSSSPLSAAPRCDGEHALQDRAQIERRPQVAAFDTARCSRVPANRSRRARRQPHRRRGTRTSLCRDPCRACRSRRRSCRIP